jgi:uncharacterized C2H2 Zn-finger protein
MIVSPGTRFTRLRWGDERGGPAYGLPEPSPQSSGWTLYVCPRCKTEIGFERADFLKHVGSSFSNLIYQDRQAVEQEAAPRLTDENGFADFYCPGCNGVVRTYFRYEGPEERIHAGWLVLRIVVERETAATKPN